VQMIRQIKIFVQTFVAEIEIVLCY